MVDPDLFDAADWCGLDLAVRRQRLLTALTSALSDSPGISALSIEVGPIGQEYDLVACVESDVGKLRTPLWSHARATLFCDASVHPANRAQFGPGQAIAEAADRLRHRLAIPYRLESRGLTFSLRPEEGVERTWTAEHSRFRKRTAVLREDRVVNPGELDVRDLLNHFYTGPSLRLIADDGEAFLLGPATEAEGPLVTLCHSCSRWSTGAVADCPHCQSSAVDTVVAARPPRGS